MDKPIDLFNPHDFNIIKANEGGQRLLTKNNKPAFFIPDEFVDDMIWILSFALKEAIKNQTPKIIKKMIQQDFQWIRNCIVSSWNEFHFDSCDILIRLFKMKYSGKYDECEGMVTDLQLLLDNKRISS